LATFGEWEFTCDALATREAYARAEAGGSDTCTCIWCRNFRLVRVRVYPVLFIEFGSAADAGGIHGRVRVVGIGRDVADMNGARMT
jgi:hypothetical protein